MAAKNINFYLIKTVRISGWLLLLLVPLYIATGFAIRGDLGFSKLLDPEKATIIHQDFRWPLVTVFLVHSSTAVYFAMRRWGWIRKKISP